MREPSSSPRGEAESADAQRPQGLLPEGGRKHPWPKARWLVGRGQGRQM
ncbi:MAG TPA: hypothetical protein VF099_11595 [Ktedonobacterales bacterium]